MTDTTPLARAVAILDAADIGINEHRDIAHGTQLRLDNGAIANIYASGSVVVQGPPAAAAPVRKAFDAAGSLKPSKAKAPSAISAPRSAPPVDLANEPQTAPAAAPYLPPGWTDKPANPDDDTPPW